MSTALRNTLVDLGEAEQWGEGMIVSLLELAPFAESGAVPFKSSRFTVAPGCTSPVDQHDVREMWMIASGQGLLIHAGKEVAVSPGSICFFDSQEPHEVTNEGEIDLLVFSIWWDK